MTESYVCAGYQNRAGRRSAELEEAVQGKQMADAQASMLRSCLEDTEELLEESRSKVNLLEEKLQANNLEKSTGKEDDIEELRGQTSEAESRASAALERAKALSSRQASPRRKHKKCGSLPKLSATLPSLL